MKKEEVYKLIEYNGKFDEKVKKNLKKIIKKYHPDKNNGDTKIIKVIYEVKRELEEGNVSYHPKKKSVNTTNNEEFISKSDCIAKIEKLTLEKVKLDKKLKDAYNKLSTNFKEYSDLYSIYCKNQNEDCEIKDKIKQIKKISKWELISYFVFVLSIIIYLNNYHIFTFLLLFITIGYLLYINCKKYKNLDKIKKKYDRLRKNFEKINSEINIVRETIDKNSEKIHSLEREITRIDNDIRFYQNRFNKK